MLFELRGDPASVSPSWEAIRDEFVAGEVREAWRRSREQRGKAPLSSANDYLLQIEISRACGARKTYLALVRLGIARFPSDPLMQLYHARALLTRKRHLAAMQYLESRRDTLGVIHPAYWATELASVYGDAGFYETARRWLDRARQSREFESPLALYTAASAFESLLEWEQAIESLQSCLQLRPGWVRARVFLAHCLMARGRRAEAQAELFSVEKVGLEDADAESAAAMITMMSGQYDEAVDRFRRAVERWPQSQYAAWLRRMLCILLVEMGRLEEARERFAGQEEKLGLPPLPADGPGKHCLVPLPIATQNKDQCVPTSVAMAAWPQGRELNADQLFREMHGRDGTAIWQMRAWAEDHGFACLSVQLERQAISELLDLGIPLIGVLEGVFHSHVDVVCGYSEKLDVMYVRDPAHWLLTAWPWKLAVARYELWSGVIAVIDASNQVAIEAARRWQSADGNNLIDLSEHVAKGDFAHAAEAYARIGDDSKSIVLREQYAAWTLRSPDQFATTMRAVASDSNAPFVARFRALTAVDEAALRTLLDEDAESAQQELGRGGFRLLRLRRLMFSGEWEKALKLVDELIDTGVGVAMFWDMKSDILAQLGQHEASVDSLRKAIELEPLRVSFREKLLARSDHKLTYSDYLDQLESLISEDPASRGLLVARAQCLRDDPDGLKYESAMREVIRWYPKHSAMYSELMWWFRQQDREDLAAAVHRAAKAELPGEFADNQDSTASDQDAASRDGRDADDIDLPVETTELLAIGLAEHDRRAAALDELERRCEAGQLDWHEQARLLVARIRYSVASGLDVQQIRQMLPPSIPGAAHWYLDAFADELTEEHVPREVADVVQAWMRERLANYEDYQQVWFNIVLLLEHAHRNEDALRELTRLLERYPKMSAALYRMGVIKINQADWAGAREWLERALEVSPGLYGGMAALRLVCQQLGDERGELACVRTLAAKFPYDLSYLRDEVLARGQQGDISTALERIGDAAERFPDEWLRLLRAHVLVEGGQVDAAERQMEGITVDENADDELLFETHLRAALAVACAKKNHEDAAAICDRGLRRWPESAYLATRRAYERSFTDRERAFNELRDFVYQQSPDRQSIGLLLDLAAEPAEQMARRLVDEGPDERQQVLAEWLAEVFEAAEYSDRRLPFLEWAYQRFPRSDVVTENLAFAYDYYGREEEAAACARSLLERRPGDPSAMRLLGRSLIRIDPGEGRRWLEKACELDRNINYLCDLARCYQDLGLRDRSVQLHWEILRQNPYVAVSWTSLYLQKQDRGSLWPYVPRMLEAGVGIEDESFLVAVVDAAVVLKTTVPAPWYDLAKARWNLVTAYGGHGNEKELLPAALTAWQMVHRKTTKDDPRYLTGWIRRLKARYGWPGVRWVPRSG